MFPGSGRDGGDDLDLMPPRFDEGLDDWSRGDGTPESAIYEAGPTVRIARNDADFATCLELRKVDLVQRLRYMGEVPIRYGAFIEVAARVKVTRGPLPLVRIAAWAGGAHGRGVGGLAGTGPLLRIERRGAVCALVAVIGPEAGRGVDLVWGPRVLYGHVGLDLVGECGATVRIESIRVQEVSDRFGCRRPRLPGFGPRLVAVPAGAGAARLTGVRFPPV